MDHKVVLNNGTIVGVEDADVTLDSLENALVFTFETGIISKFYWPNVAYYVSY